MSANSFIYNGIEYRSIKDACRALKKEYWNILKRLNSGWAPQQAFDDEPRRYGSREFEFNGVIYNGVQDAVRQLNSPVSATTVRRRLEQGMSAEEALFSPSKAGYDNGIIYTITNLINGLQYIGLTTTSVEERWSRHLEQSVRENASLIHKAIAKFGKENFVIEIVDRASNIKELQTKERDWISRLNTLQPNGYNVTAGGEIGGNPGKVIQIPGDETIYPSIHAAARSLAERENISFSAAEKRIQVGNINARKRHGLSKTPLYRYWDNLVHQASNPRSDRYLGLKVCDRWKIFLNFYEDVQSGYQAGMVLQLVDQSLPYSKENCIWSPNGELQKTHGMAKTKVYRIWSDLIHCIANPKSKKYKNVSIDPCWQSFEIFYEQTGRFYENGKSLRLINESLPYSSDNCKWDWTYGEQKQHPMFGTPIYKVWNRTVNQYCNPDSKSYTGGSICDRWRNFSLFCEDMLSTYQQGLKLIRIDFNRPYSPDNCKWAKNQHSVQSHGMVGTKFYGIWSRLKVKRTNPKSKAYEGAVLCDRWKKFESFKEDMHNSYQEGMGLRLIDPSLPYSKENCKWLSRSDLHKKKS